MTRRREDYDMGWQRDEMVQCSSNDDVVEVRDLHRQCCRDRPEVGVDLS